MDKWYIEYKVQVVGDQLDENSSFSVDSFYGVICAKSLAEATSELEAFYGDQLKSIEFLSWAMETLYEFNFSENNFSVEVKEAK